jgi:hypothetical protein
VAGTGQAAEKKWDVLFFLFWPNESAPDIDTGDDSTLGRAATSDAI